MGAHTEGVGTGEGSPGEAGTREAARFGKAPSAGRTPRLPHRARLPRRARRRAAAGSALALAAALALGACSSSETDKGDDGNPAGSDASGTRLKVSGAYLPQPVMADMAGGFLVIENTGDRADSLTKVTSELSDDVQLHRTVDRQMERTSSLPVPAHGKLRLSRGGNHLMFMDLKRKPTKGDTVSITLHFDRHQPIKVPVPVKATNHTAAGDTADTEDHGGGGGGGGEDGGGHHDPHGGHTDPQGSDTDPQDGRTDPQGSHSRNTGDPFGTDR